MTTTALQYKNREAPRRSGPLLQTGRPDEEKPEARQPEAHYETMGLYRCPEMQGLYRSMDSRRIDAQRFPRWVKTSGGLSKPMLKRAQIIFEVIDWVIR